MSRRHPRGGAKTKDGVLRRAVMIAALALGAIACATPAERATAPCGTVSFRIDADFERGAFAACRPTGRDAATLAIRPETGAANDSPWYAFRVRSTAPAVITVTLDYEGGAHRYWPKINADGRVWTRARAEDVRIDGNGETATVRVRTGKGPVFIAAQPLETVAGVIAAIDGPLTQTGFSARVLGSSADGQPIVAYESLPPGAESLVIFLARQHPPETTGAVAFEAFVLRLAADDAAARAFRRRHGIFIAPLINPDGFVRGHWRGNADGADVNRDWGPFETPEASAVSRRILALARAHRPVFLADFHSTRRSVIYAAPEGLDEPGLADAFLERLTLWQGASPPPISRSHASSRTTAKAWSLETLGVSGFTYEVADDADPSAVKAAARAAAQILLEVSLARED